MEPPGAAQDSHSPHIASEKIIESLAEAFYADPTMVYLFPDHEKRMSRLKILISVVTKIIIQQRTMYADHTHQSVCLWQQPCVSWQSLFYQELLCATLLYRLAPAAKRIAQLHFVQQKNRPKYAHWYLFMVGTKPAVQGRGLATGLIKPVLQHCDQQGLPVYLECSKETISFYLRFGFRVYKEATIKNELTLYSMLRPPGQTKERI
ncbi:GNAT family N-acetyltransferase [Hahella sp. CR1]|uniref:GNAT family N-acetyltransferase n=1 Tax=Hahella sp. CR1 TaxID=2992807 RepID=UPI0024421311|nr:GNAT family N-acetyltransferase [Hahella sp. CR1]MDG9667019.1 GNAT family N-acetyltransferase [Hahella sp. CR1]